MTPTQSFRIASRLTLTTMLVMFGLIVIGSVVRTTGSGLACPDWPLCQGRLIPPLQFNVLVEWLHRLVALMVSVLLFATVAWIVARREVRARLGGVALLCVGLLVVQVVLGALTVWKLLDPSVVAAHLGVALLLFSTLIVLTVGARAEASPEPRPVRSTWLLPSCALAAIGTFGQALLGATVSANHAGLACPDWPTCNGEWLPPLRGLVGLHMAHRYGAYALVPLVMWAATQGWSAPDLGVRRGTFLALTLTAVQVMIGIMNVLLGTPWWLSAAHLATATAILALLVTATCRSAMLPVSERMLAAAAP